MDQSRYENWTIVSLSDRFDSTNFVEVRAEVEDKISIEEHFLAFDFRHLKFLSIPAIKFLAYTAEYLSKNGGNLALISPSNRLCRHIEVYATMENIQVFKMRKKFPGENPFLGLSFASRPSSGVIFV